MNINIMRKNDGISMQDVVIAITILAMFVGVVGNLFYQISLNSNLVKMNAIAVYYAIKVAEEVDRLPYEDINENFNIYINSQYELPEMFTLNVDVQKYSDQDTSKEDIIKIVDITVEYTVLDETRDYKLKKIKVKEL